MTGSNFLIDTPTQTKLLYINTVPMAVLKTWRRHLWRHGIFKLTERSGKTNSRTRSHSVHPTSCSDVDMLGIEGNSRLVEHCVVFPASSMKNSKLAESTGHTCNKVFNSDWQALQNNQGQRVPPWWKSWWDVFVAALARGPWDHMNIETTMRDPDRQKR